MAAAAAVCRAGRVQTACATIASRLKLVIMLLHRGFNQKEKNLKLRVEVK